LIYKQTYCIEKKVFERSGAILFKIKHFAVKILQFPSKSALYPLGENISRSKNIHEFGQIAKK